MKVPHYISCTRFTTAMEGKTTLWQPEHLLSALASPGLATSEHILTAEYIYCMHEWL